MQTGPCSLPAQMWDPLQGQWVILLDSLKSWSKCFVYSTRRSATWRRKRWSFCSRRFLITTCGHAVVFNVVAWHVSHSEAICNWYLKCPWKTKSLTRRLSLLLICTNILRICCILDLLLQSKLDDYQVRKDKGENLNQDQLVGALKPYNSVH